MNNFYFKTNLKPNSAVETVESVRIHIKMEITDTNIKIIITFEDFDLMIAGFRRS